MVRSCSAYPLESWCVPKAFDNERVLWGLVWVRLLLAIWFLIIKWGPNARINVLGVTLVLRVTSVVSLLLGLLWFGSIFLRFPGPSGLVQGCSLDLVLFLCISIFLPRGLIVLLILNSCCCPTYMSIIHPLFVCIFSLIRVCARDTFPRREVCPLYSRAQYRIRPQNLVYGLSREICLRERSLI